MQATTSKFVSSIALAVALSTTACATVKATPHYAIGRCQIADGITAGTDAPGVMISPMMDADSYISDYQNESNSPLKKYATDKYSFDQAAIKITEAPKHGTIILNPNIGPNISAEKNGFYYYISNKNYYGEDTFVMQVKKYGLKIYVHYTIEIPAADENSMGLCPDQDSWKIS